MTVLLMAGIAVLAIGLALWPLWGGAPKQGLQRRTLNVAGYRTRLQELEIEQQVGTITEEAAQPLRDEAAARLLVDAGSADERQPDTAQTPRSWVVFAIGACLIVAVSVSGYLLSGSRQQADWIAQAAKDPAAAQKLAVESMVQRLETRLATEPNDGEGWAMLGRSYYVTGRFADSAGAYERANRLRSASPDPDLLADEGEVRVLLQDHDLRGLPRELFERALAIDPGQPKALWYGGLAAAQAGEYSLAVDRWLILRKGDLPENFRASLDERLKELAQLAGREIKLDAIAAAPDSEAHGTDETVVAAAGEGLVLDVSIAPELASSVGASDTLFVVARRPDAPGPPLAVRRLSASSLPAQITLDDSNAMAPNIKLSSSDRWDIIARVSRSGTAQAQSGDLEGRLTVSRDQAQSPIKLVIAKRVP
ncbi:MAG: c-type cytochrome biogenesis protein CcmI [Pseudomonadota bacterium]|nr:c-type cytochrome biogenesis protein CcmI [Pseudomonadota bacterium]